MSKKGTSEFMHIILQFAVYFFLAIILLSIIFVYKKTQENPFFTGECDCATGEGCDMVSCADCENCEFSSDKCMCTSPSSPVT